MELAKEGFEDIIWSWQNGVYVNSLYSMIYYWIKKNKQVLAFIPEIKDIYYRIKSSESSRDIVQDFLIGERYESLREKFFAPS